jgi:hypothetical protein
MLVGDDHGGEVRDGQVLLQGGEGAVAAVHPQVG